MTRKDYEALQENLGERREVVADDIARDVIPDRAYKNVGEAYLAGFDDAVNGVIQVCADNPRFDREHFLAVVRGEREAGSKPEHKEVI